MDTNVFNLLCEWKDLEKLWLVKKSNFILTFIEWISIFYFILSIYTK